MRPLILLCNDDGPLSPGLLTLHRALLEVGDVSVVVPERDWSAGGHSKTFHQPLRADPVRLADGSAAICTSGSPADCVALALLGLVDRRPSLVFSGINLGANLGQDLIYSGTIAAAREAFIAGITGVAVSLAISGEGAPDLDTASRFAAHLASHLLQEEPSRPLLLNVNVPACCGQRIKGVRITRLGRRIYRDTLITRQDPRGRHYYWIGGERPAGVPEEGTDIGALASNEISITPLSLDFTDYQGIERLVGWGLDPPAHQE